MVVEGRGEDTGRDELGLGVGTGLEVLGLGTGLEVLGLGVGTDLVVLGLVGGRDGLGGDVPPRVGVLT
jgi:hypothetical protein